MPNKQRLVKLFTDLVRIKSTPKKEKDAALFLQKELKKIGLAVRYDSAAKKINGQVGNMYATFKGDPSLPVILLNAHIDTVEHQGEVRPVIRGGKIFSSGDTILGADCKAGVAAMIEAVRQIIEKKIPHGDIKLCFTVAEEIGLIGAKAANREWLKADIGLVIDGGKVDCIINMAPSQISVEARIIGKAAHAGVHPEDGINAIKAASDAISGMKLGRIDKETTANIGIIKGGIATNIVPEKVTIKGEARSHNKEKLKKQVGHMVSCIRLACKKNKAKADIKIVDMYRSFYVNSGNRYLRSVMKAAKKQGLSPKLVMTGGGSDANVFNRMGIPSMILGVGMTGVHTSRESIKISDLAEGCGLIIAAIAEIASANGK